MEVPNREAIPEMKRQRQSRGLNVKVSTRRKAEQQYRREWRRAWAILWPIVDAGIAAEVAREAGQRFDAESRAWGMVQAAINRAAVAVGLNYEPDALGLATLAMLAGEEATASAKRTIVAVAPGDPRNAKRLAAIDRFATRDPRVLRGWVANNVALIKSIPQRELGAMHRIVTQASTRGTRVETLRKQLRARFGYGKRHAELVARDQMAKVNAQVAQQAMREAGATRYRWVTSLDSRVRKEHRVLHNSIQSWDDPPVAGSRGERGHPGVIFQCRCVALPVLDDVDQPPVTSTRASAQGFGPT